MHEHPTQALLDAYTILRHKKKLNGLQVADRVPCVHDQVGLKSVQRPDPRHEQVASGRQVRIGYVQDAQRRQARGQHRHLEAAQGEPVPLDDGAVGEGAATYRSRGPEGLEGS